MQYVIPFEEIKKDDVLTAGGKGANLGETKESFISLFVNNKIFLCKIQV